MHPRTRSVVIFTTRDTPFQPEITSQTRMGNDTLTSLNGNAVLPHGPLTPETCTLRGIQISRTLRPAGEIVVPITFLLTPIVRPTGLTPLRLPPIRDITLGPPPPTRRSERKPVGVVREVGSTPPLTTRRPCPPTDGIGGVGFTICIHKRVVPVGSMARFRQIGGGDTTTLPPNIRSFLFPLAEGVTNCIRKGILVSSKFRNRDLLEIKHTNLENK